MDSILDFVKDLSLRFDRVLTLYIFGGAFVIFIVANWIISFRPPDVARRFRKVLNIVFGIVFIAAMTLIVVNVFLTERYSRLFSMLLAFIYPSLRGWIDSFYRRYDKLVDRVVGIEFPGKKKRG